ncbi:ArsR family transcriptional regulator [Streptomyces sp. HC44]|uniref:ArsR family transcriptional regulator n=1 Tax=Streptomyces scabichelini TaxID=2711217 RepID=A0A6G4V5T1_9ACTN|nr:ArsR family transcriptional regulator [Streptomyces scabichelini]
MFPPVHTARSAAALPGRKGGEIAHELEMSRPRVSRHLRVLREAEVVAVRATLGRDARRPPGTAASLGQRSSEVMSATHTTVIDGRPALQFECHLKRSREKVWPAVTDPRHLSQWYPFRVTETGAEGRRAACLRRR